MRTSTIPVTDWLGGRPLGPLGGLQEHRGDHDEQNSAPIASRRTPAPSESFGELKDDLASGLAAVWPASHVGARRWNAS
jgi:hypothetical protein